MSEKLCVFCEHWEIDGGHPDYSELTGGDPATMDCHKGHYRYMDSQLTDTRPDIFRAIILKAETCPDYEQVEP